MYNTHPKLYSKILGKKCVLYPRFYDIGAVVDPEFWKGEGGLEVWGQTRSPHKLNSVCTLILSWDFGAI